MRHDRTLTVDQLIERVRRRADIVDSAFFTDDELADYITDSQMALEDAVIRDAVRKCREKMEMPDAP
jgi:hypothetical protein